MNLIQLPPQVLVHILGFLNRNAVLDFRATTRKALAAMGVHAFRHMITTRVNRARHSGMLVPESLEEFVYADAVRTYSFGRHDIIVRGDMPEILFLRFLDLIGLCGRPSDLPIVIIGRVPLSSKVSIALEVLMHFKISPSLIETYAPPPQGLEHVLFTGYDFTLELRCDTDADSQHVADAIRRCKGKRGACALRIRYILDHYTIAPIQRAWDEHEPEWPMHKLTFVYYY